MAANYWIKLYQDILRDPQMGMLSDSAFRRCIELFLLAGEQPERNGTLPETLHIAWELRVSHEQLMADIAELTKIGVIQMVDGRPFVVNFAKRQAAIGGAERVSQHRQREKTRGSNANVTANNGNRNEPVTKRYTDIQKTDIQKTEEEGGDPPNPPNGRFRPSPVEPIQKPPIEELTDAILEVCNLRRAIPAHLAKAESAASQIPTFTADYILARYSHGGGGSWNWYTHDFRGQRGSPPSPAQVVDTITTTAVTPQPTNGHKNGRALSNNEQAALEYAKLKESFR